MKGCDVMKICILSMQKVDNYGSVLQAYSLKKIIESLGHDVSFIDIKNGECLYLNNECYISSMKPTFSKNSFSKIVINKIKNKYESLKYKKMFDNFRSEYLNIKRNDNNEKYDLCIIGSDEVFNCMQKSKWGFNPQLFGKVENANKVITYAACCGYTKVEMLPDNLKKEIKKCLNNIQFFSVRDENTKRFVEELTDKNCILNLDPVVVGDFENEIENSNIEGKVPDKYCILYSYKNRFSDTLYIEKIKNYCESNNLKLIAPFGSQKWIKKSKILSPFELLKAFKNAELIITDTFHGTIFGAKFGKKLAIIVRDSNKNKLLDLVTRLGIKNNVVNSVEDFDNVIDTPINKNMLNNIIELERNNTISYLKNHIH